MHVRDIEELEVASGIRSADVTARRILSPGQTGRSSAFSLSVAFIDRTAEGNLEEIQDVLGDGSRTSNQLSDSSAKESSELVEDE